MPDDAATPFLLLKRRVCVFVFVFALSALLKGFREK